MNNLIQVVCCSSLSTLSVIKIYHGHAHDLMFSFVSDWMAGPILFVAANESGRGSVSPE